MARLHRYRVGMLSNSKQVEAPSPLAAAVFFGIHVLGSAAQNLAAVFEEDGRPWRGEAVWMRWSLGDEPAPDVQERLRNELPLCRFVQKPGLALRAA